MKANCVTPWVLSAFLSFHCLAAAESEDSAGGPQDQKAACKQNLKKIYQAIQDYRADHKDLPNWMSDMVPQYIEDKTVFICPATQGSGQPVTMGINDPKLKTSYIYEFCAQPIPGAIWGGDTMTMRDWKRLQMAMIGGDVPLLRCHNHDQALNIGFNGRAFESETTWENQYADVLNPGDLSPAGIRSKFRLADSAVAGRAAPPPSRRLGPEAEEANALVGKPAPPIKLDLLEGGTFDLSSHQGKDILILDFWATWCGPCRSAMPVLSKLADEYKDKDVKYYAIDLRESPEVIKKFIEKEDLDIQVPLDRNGEVAKSYGVRGIPTMVLVDKEGIVRKYHIGFSPNLKETLSSSLHELVNYYSARSGSDKEEVRHQEVTDPAPSDEE